MLLCENDSESSFSRSSAEFKELKKNNTSELNSLKIKTEDVEN